MEMQNCTDIIVALFILTDHLFIVGVDKEGECNAVCTQGGLDDIGNVMVVGFLIEIGLILSGRGLMCSQVEVGARGNPPKLALAEWEHKFKIRGCIGVVGQLFLFVVTQTEIFFFDV